MSLEFRRPTAKVTWPFGDVSSDNVAVNVAINANTTVTFTAYTGQEAAASSTRVLAKDAASLMGKAQAHGFSKRTDPDTKLELDDGGGNKLAWEGLLTGPTYLVDPRNIKPGFAAVSRSALLTNLKLDMYASAGARGDANQPMASGIASIEQKVTSPNLADRLADLTRLIIRHWETYKGSERTTASKTLREERHQINQEGPLQLWYELLENSRDSLENAWLPALAKKADANNAFNRDMLSLLQGVSRDFQEVISAIASAFQLVHIPGRDGGPGYLASMYELLTAEPETLVLPATSLMLNGRSGEDLLPIQQVLVLGKPVQGVATDQPWTASYQTDSGDFLVGGFPEDRPSASGEVLTVPLPPFLSGVIRAFAQGPPKGFSPPASSSLPEQRLRVSSIVQKFQAEVSDKLVLDYCRSIYIDAALGGTATSIAMPARLDLWPGKRYEVRGPSGDPLFVGFLAGIQHAFTRASGQGQAMSTCNFSHILFPGFTLPGI